MMKEPSSQPGRIRLLLPPPTPAKARMLIQPRLLKKGIFGLEGPPLLLLENRLLLVHFVLPILLLKPQNRRSGTMLPGVVGLRPPLLLLEPRLLLFQTVVLPIMLLKPQNRRR
jgi:hypothetical protein